MREVSYRNDPAPFDDFSVMLGRMLKYKATITKNVVTVIRWCYEMSKNGTLNLVSVVLCCAAALFFMIGCLGYSSSGSTIQDVAWIVVDQKGSTMFYALKGEVRIFYSDCADANNACATCEDKGRAAFGLMILATLSAVLTAIVCGLLVNASHQLSTCYSTNPRMRLICIVLALVAVGTSLGALVAFMGDCYNAIDDVTADDLKWGPGSVLLLVGLLMMACVALMQTIGGCRLK